jgi:predicted O-methyltransferase YrrM
VNDYHRIIADAVIMQAAKLGRPVDYIEIGVLTGNSAEAVLQTWKVRHAQLIDDWSLEYEGQKRTREMVEKRLEIYNGLFLITEGDSRKIVPTIAGHFDVGFVDGDHSTEGCRIDCENMMKLIREDGVMFVHDTANESFKLREVVIDFADRYELSVEFHDCMNGLAEIRREPAWIGKR